MKPAIHGRASTAFKVLRVAAVLAALSFAPFAGSAATQEAEVTVDGAATITTNDHPSGTTAPLASGADDSDAAAAPATATTEKSLAQEKQAATHASPGSKDQSKGEDASAPTTTKKQAKKSPTKKEKAPQADAKKETPSPSPVPTKKSKGTGSVGGADKVHWTMSGAPTSPPSSSTEGGSGGGEGEGGERVNTFTTETIKVAVKLWCDKPYKARATYGHISTWDTSGVTSMFSLFYEFCDKRTTFNDDIGGWDGQ